MPDLFQKNACLAVPLQQSCDAICELPERGPGYAQHFVPDPHNGYMFGKRRLLREEVFEDNHRSYSYGKGECSGYCNKCDIGHLAVLLTIFSGVVS
jgi:hypothetical protein